MSTEPTGKWDLALDGIGQIRALVEGMDKRLDQMQRDVDFTRNEVTRRVTGQQFDGELRKLEAPLRALQEQMTAVRDGLGTINERLKAVETRDAATPDALDRVERRFERDLAAITSRQRTLDRTVTVLLVLAFMLLIGVLVWFAFFR